MERTLPRPIDIPWPPARWVAFGALALCCTSLVLWLGRDLTFAWDECVVMARPLGDWLRPHNEHWYTGPTVAWQGVTAIFGTGSYLPFLGLLAALNVALAAGVYVALGSGLMALGAAALLLLLGSGASQLFWAVQIAFVGSIAGGVWALLLIERERYGWASVLLLVSVASSGMGLPFLVAGLVMGAMKRRGARLLLPVLAYGAWYVAFGRSAVGTIDPLRVPRIIAEQTVDSLGALTGLPGMLVLVVLVGAAAYFAWRGWRPEPLVVASIVGIVSLFGIIGLVRDDGYADRYQTAFVAFTLLIVGRMPWTRRIAPIGLLALALALVVNVGGMLAYQHEWALWYPTHSCEALGL